MPFLLSAVERAARTSWQQHGPRVVRGLAIGALFGLLTGLLTQRWDLAGWFTALGVLIDFFGVFASNLWRNLRGADGEWESFIEPSGWLLNGLQLHLVPRDGRYWTRHWGKACVVRAPSGREERREGVSTTYVFGSAFPSLVPVEPGRYEVTWLTKTRKGKWLHLLRDHFDLDANGQPANNSWVVDTPLG